MNISFEARCVKKAPTHLRVLRIFTLLLPLSVTRRGKKSKGVLRVLGNFSGVLDDISGVLSVLAVESRVL